MSGIDFSKLGAPTNAAQTTGSGAEKEKAQYWLNIGYTTTAKVGEGKEAVEETRFIALPGGVPMDSLKHVPTNSTNTVYAAQQQARNALYDSVMELLAGFEPGDDRILNLQVQARRINAERPEADVAENIFVSQAPKLV